MPNENDLFYLEIARNTKNPGSSTPVPPKGPENKKQNKKGNAKSVSFEKTSDDESLASITKKSNKQPVKKLTKESRTFDEFNESINNDALLVRAID